MLTKRNVIASDAHFRVMIEAELTPAQTVELDRLIVASVPRDGIARVLRAWARCHGLTIHFDELTDDRD